MDNPDNISYDEGWKNAYEPLRYESADIAQAQPKKSTKKKRSYPFPLLISIQIIICLLIVLSAFVIKQIGGELYRTVKSEFNKNINNEIILKDSFESFTLNTVSDVPEN